MLRRIVKSDGVWSRHASKPCRYPEALEGFKCAATVAGFLDPSLSFYAIRRLDATLLRAPDLREGDVRSAMGHNPNSHVFENHYVSKNQVNDLLGLAVAGEQNLLLYDSTPRADGLPHLLTRQQLQTIESSPEVSALLALQQNADSNDRQAITLALASARSRLRAQLLHDARREIVKDRQAARWIDATPLPDLPDLPDLPVLPDNMDISHPPHPEDLSFAQPAQGWFPLPDATDNDPSVTSSLTVLGHFQSLKL